MDDKKIFFMSGLPRSGSTVLCNILQQHPDVFTVPTDPICSVIRDILINVYDSNIGTAFDFDVFDKGLHNFIVDGLNGYYSSLTDKPVILSKNRQWYSLSHLFPQAKYIATVRNLFDVASSILRQQDNNRSIVTPIADGLTFVPNAGLMESLKHAIINEASFQLAVPSLLTIGKKHPGKVKWVRYEDMVSNGSKILNDLEHFMGISHHEYDFNNIQQQALYEHDAVYSGESSHTTQSRLQNYSTSKKPVMPDNFRDVLANHEKTSWFYETFYPVDQH